MRLPLNWLHDFTTPDLEPRALATLLAMTGTEVDRIDHHGVDALEFFVVGKVISAEQHPDADRLRVCMVDVGTGGEPSQIVCGAPNVAAGQTVAVSLPGAIMTDGSKLKASKLRGQPSNGMILADAEVGLAEERAGGIMVLDDALAAGTPLADVLPISDTVLELEVTPNRPDCLGVYGVAREVHAAAGSDLAAAPWTDDPHPAGDSIPGITITVEVPELNPRFTARAFENVKIGPSPDWLRVRLLAAGQRPINNVVDITNYTMWLTGQPLHAFDLDRVAGGTLNVRAARDGETLTTLDDAVRTLDPDVVVIEDGEGPTSMAGVMGGQRSEVHEGTTRVLMEVATWDGPNINRTMAKFNLRSEAGARYEKGLAPEQTLEAQAIASRLMIDVVGATPVGGTIDVGGPGPELQTIRLRDARVVSLLGAPVERTTSARILTALGFGVSEAADGLDVTVPAFRRRDVTREADLIEEVARLNGFDTLPSTVPENRTGLPGRLTAAQRLQRRAEDVLVGRGLHEVVGWSFTEPALLDRLRVPADHRLRQVVELENPMSAAQSILRPTIVGSLLDVASHNAARGMGDVAIFESGTVYLKDADPAQPLADEHHALAALVTGPTTLTSWRGGASQGADVFVAKGLLEAVAAALRVTLTFAPSADWPFLHPGRTAEVLLDGTRVGFAGEVHPAVAAQWDLEARPVGIFAVNLQKLIAAAPDTIAYQDLTSYPAVRQDLAVVVPDTVPAADVVALVGQVADEVRIFDVYTGEQVGAGKTSIALRVSFRAKDRTLGEEDITRLRSKLVKRLDKELGGELRG
ncbi:Phenylalanine--tRNA ligase beta subunit [Paraconexibacter sp. AEG42_29]|uniref:Phenylalanine--tRNA ligase beta subunit n=1 Tax=Paraconexibacter sp. AEG42_29 TaxID=2997339 RepID=A0AAU7AUT4_9ACTN